ncbi:protein [Escherichia coli]|nr:protein [Escherichia coli]
MKSVFTISASLAISLMLCCTAQANDHKLLGVIAMPRNETNDLALKLPVCRIVKRIQLSADHGDLQLSGASVYFKAARSASQSLNIPSEIKEGQTTDWININSDNDNKTLRLKNHLFRSYGELIGYGHAENYRRRLTPEYRNHKK